VNEGPDCAIFLNLAPYQIHKWHEVLFDVRKVLLTEDFLHVLLSISCHLFVDSPKVALLNDQRV
jgi:hypothetical protein